MKHANDNLPSAADPAAANTSGGLRFLSVCSGIEAASVAWHPLGWRAVGFSEIEKFPSAVLKHHYPDVPNFGDFTKIDVTALGQVDILCGGTPCQAFSVAGLREGLKDPRGNLTLKFVELAHELADRNGLRNAVWENVVGVLSDKGNAFGCFLAGLVGADAPIKPPGRWTNAGMVSGPRGRAAWRVLDAQYFGVAQRRRRVIVVADFGNGADPAAVLLIEQGLPRHPPARGEAGQGVAGTISARTKGCGGLETDFDLDGGLIEHPVAYGGNRTSGPLDVATAVNAHGGPHGRLDFESETFVAHAIQAGALRTNPTSGPDGVGVQAHIAYTLEARAEVQAVAFVQNSRDEVRLMGGSGDIVGSLAAAPGAKQQCYVAHSVAIRGRDGGATAELGGEVATALRASQGGGDKPHVLCFSAKDYGADAAVDIAPTLRAGGHASSHANAGVMPAIAFNAEAQADQLPGLGRDTEVNDGLTVSQRAAVATTSAVRRLTPVECERLQGFPDGYTAIPWRGKAADQCPDGPRYKALGNSWAVPKFVWLGKRIQALMPAINAQRQEAA